jgi:uncharacterized protein YjbI with pentapeptide repeats
MKGFIEYQTFEGVDFKENELVKGEYENCMFKNCVLADCNLSGLRFSECRFESCDLSMTNLAGTSLINAQFRNCKMLGMRFDSCNKLLLSFSFEGCVLNFSSFYQLKVKKTHFKDCKLQEVEFIASDFSASAFFNCDMMHARFENTILERADFRTAYNFSIDPEINKVSKARFSQAGIAGLLDKYNIEIE